MDTRRLFWPFPQACAFLFVAPFLAVCSLALQCLLVHLARKRVSSTELTPRSRVWTWIPGVWCFPRASDMGTPGLRLCFWFSCSPGDFTVALQLWKGWLQRKETDKGLCLLEAEKGQEVGRDVACILGVRQGTEHPCGFKLPAVVNWKKDFMSGTTFLLFDVASLSFFPSLSQLFFFSSFPALESLCLTLCCPSSLLITLPLAFFLLPGVPCC